MSTPRVIPVMRFTVAKPLTDQEHEAVIQLLEFPQVGDAHPEWGVWEDVEPVAMVPTFEDVAFWLNLAVQGSGSLGPVYTHTWTPSRLTRRQRVRAAAREFRSRLREAWWVIRHGPLDNE